MVQALLTGTARRSLFALRTTADTGPQAGCEMRTSQKLPQKNLIFSLRALTCCQTLRHYSFMSVIDADRQKILKLEDLQVPILKLARSLNFVFSTFYPITK
jgi:hypothetical protein